MKRILLPMLAFVLVALGLGAGWFLMRRPAAPPPDGGDRPPFLLQAAGAGHLIEFQPSEIPIRTLRWSRPLPDRAVVAQLLTQSNRQQALLFVDGHLQATLTAERPEGISENLFHFAELQDAAYIPGRLLLLLYRVSPQGEDPLLVAWNLERGAIQWTFRGPGSRLVLSPDARAAFLYGPDAPVQIFRLAGKDGQPLAGPTSGKVALPPGVAGFTDLLATGPDTFLAIDAAGLSAWQGGTWNRLPAPARSPLGFGAPGGRLARTGDSFWWQPEPGQLIQVAPDGQPSAPQDLPGLLSGTHARDAALLHLLGADPQGGLWFAPVSPDFATPPQESSVPGIPVPAPADAAQPPTPEGQPAPPAPSLRDTWEPYLKAGLDRLYHWRPGAPAMQGFEWAPTWPRLGPPAVIPMPTGDGGLVPEADGFLLGDQEHRWWLPLASVPLAQPR
jgi:hypothetical protein